MLRQRGRAASGPKGPGSPNRSWSATVKRIRSILSRTQAELAAALGVSAKAVQSYEQGWREVPARVMIQMLVLLALYRKQTMDDIPCWEVRKCLPSQRDACASFAVGRGQFCWLIGSKSCRPPAGKTQSAFLPCMECLVVKRLLSGWRLPAVDPIEPTPVSPVCTSSEKSLCEFFVDDHSVVGDK